MKKYLYMALFFASTAALAAEAPIITVQGGNGACISGIDGDVCRHFFGGTDVTVNVAAPSSGCGQEKATLLQMSTRLTAPVDGAVTPAEFDGCKPQGLTVRLPQVVNETEFHVELTHGDGKTEELAVVPLEAYPRDILEPLKNWAKDADNALLLRDKEGKLAEFFDRNHVEYVTNGAAPHKAHKVNIIVGDPEELKEERPDGAVIYIVDKVKDVPAVLVERTAQGSTATAEIKLVDGLSADDPLSEKALMKIFNLIK
jgi:hypothetical protein